MKFRLLVLFLCMAALPVYARQSTVADSLLQKLHTARDTDRVQTFLALSQYYAYSDIPRSIRYGQQGLQLARNLHYFRGTAAALALLAADYSRVNDETQALSLRLQLLELEQKTKDLHGQIKELLYVGKVYNQLGNYPKALNYYLQALKNGEKIKDTNGIAIAKWNIGEINEKLNRDTEALNHYRESLDLLLRQKNKNYSNLTMIATTVAYFYQNHDQFQKALDEMNKSLDYAQQIPEEYNAHAVSMILANIATLYASKHDYKQALTFNEKAFDLARKKDNQILLGLSYENKERIYESMSSFRDAIAAGLSAEQIFIQLNMGDRLSQIQNVLAEDYRAINRLPDAVNYAKKALATANAAGLPDKAGEALKNLVNIYKASGNYTDAFKYQQHYQSVKDTLFNREKSKQIARLQVLYETEKKQKQIQLLQAQNGRQKILRNTLITGIALAVVIGALLLWLQIMKHRKDKTIQTSQQALMQEKLKNSRLHEEQLQQELTAKSKELTTIALNIIQKNQLLEELNDKIYKIRKETDGASLQKLQSLQHLIRHSFNLDKNWDEFRLYFEKVHDDFFKALSIRFPDLSNKELRLCALLKLNLTTKEMATILGISPDSVKMARYRLRKKLNLASESDLSTFMIKIEKEISKKSI